MGLFSSISRRYRHIRRYNEIIRVLVRYGFEDLVSYMEEKKRFSFLRRLVPKRMHTQSVQLSKWEKMRRVCEELGPTFVKFGQLLSNRADILPAALIIELERLQDSVPPVPAPIAKQVVESELKKPTGELFQSFEAEAFASASMAQVHRATLTTGEKVVLKIQRPGIHEVIEADIRVMLYLAELFSRRIPSLKSFDPIGLVRSFEKSVMEELDFIHESVNVQRFQNNFAEETEDQGHIHSPVVFRDFTTSRVLTLEYIEGVKITDLTRLEAAGLDREVIARRLAISYFRQVFDHGFFHADPHPGNLLVLPENRICYLDYGMMGSIMRKDLEQIGSLFLAVKAKNVRGIIRAIQALSDNAVIRNFRSLESDLDDFVQTNAIRSVHTNEMSTVLLQLKDIIVKHGLKVPGHFFLLARSLMTVEGVIKTLDPKLDLLKLAHPFMLKTIARHYDPLQFAKNVLNSIYEMGVYMEEFPRDLKNAIRRINTGELKVDLQHKGIDPMVHTINRVGKQIISAVVISALIVGSSLMMAYHIPPYWGESSALGSMGLILSGVLAIGMLRDIRKGDHDDWSGWSGQ